MDDRPYEPPAFAEHFKKLPPDILYHYTGQAGLVGIVKNAELWATKIQYMNDATEFGLALGLARRLLENIISNSTHPSQKAACGRLQASLLDIGDINIFAVCFCEEGDLLSQWRGYAGGRQGYALGFDSDALIQIADRSEFTLGRCIYDPAVQHEIIEQAITHCIEDELANTTRTRWGFHGPLADVLFRCGGFFKDRSFEFFKLSITHDGGLPIRYVVVGPCPHMELAKSAVTSLLVRHGIRGPLDGQQIALGSVIPFRNW